MKVVFLSTNETLGGAAIVTGRLVAALRADGVDARMVVGVRQGDAPWVSKVGQVRRKLAKVLERGEIFLNNGLERGDLWKVSTGRFGADICAHPWVREADVVVLGWINQGFLSLAQLRRLMQKGKRVVWWMHDLWCATGICHLPGECTRFELGCGCCPYLHWEKHRGDLSHRVWVDKMNLFQDSGISFVAVSRWQRDMALRSSLLRGDKIEVVPHAFPVEEYYTEPQVGFDSDKLGFISENPHKKLIVMGAARLDDPVKDFPMAIRSLNLFMERHPAEADDCEAVFFGALRNPDVLSGLKLSHRWLGTLTVGESRQLYSAASVVLSTSRFETMGATLMEGMAAGATPVTFARGGQSDIVTDGVNGYIADYGSPESIADCLARALKQPVCSREAQHASVAARFSASAVAARFRPLLQL